MFTTLLESNHKAETSVGGTITSVILHVIVFGLAIVATLHAGEKLRDEVRQHDVKFVEVKKEPPKEPDKPPPPKLTVAPPPPKGFQVLTAPINIPDKIPDVDLSKAVTNEADFTGKGVEGGIAKGVAGGKAKPNADQPYFEFQVEKQALPREGNAPPVYPALLEQNRVEGEVLAQFVVDTSGRADMTTFKVLKSTNDLFTASVKNALVKMRFYPAEVGGHKVKQVVQQPFAFTVPK